MLQCMTPFHRVLIMTSCSSYEQEQQFSWNQHQNHDKNKGLVVFVAVCCSP